MLLALAVPIARAETQVWQFRVLLDGREIGEHRFELNAAGAQRELSSRARFDVRVLFVDAYRYRHEALEGFDLSCFRSCCSPAAGAFRRFPRSPSSSAWISRVSWAAGM
jgi:hypothetical protein